MSYKMKVPLVAQSQSMSCWYAATCMVTYFKEAGPRLGVPEIYARNEGITIDEMEELAVNEGLQSEPTGIENYTSSQLEGSLRQFGPLWTAGYWFGFGHIIVITGIDTDSNTVFFNDPDGGIEKTGSLDWFNLQREQQVSPLYY